MAKVLKDAIPPFPHKHDLRPPIFDATTFMLFVFNMYIFLFFCDSHSSLSPVSIGLKNNPSLARPFPLALTLFHDDLFYDQPHIVLTFLFPL